MLKREIARYTKGAKPMDKVPDSTVHGANMGPIWGRQDPGGPHVGPMNFGIWSGWLPLVQLMACRACGAKPFFNQHRLLLIGALGTRYSSFWEKCCVSPIACNSRSLAVPSHVYPPHLKWYGAVFHSWWCGPSATRPIKTASTVLAWKLLAIRSPYV